MVRGWLSSSHLSWRNDEIPLERNQAQDRASGLGDDPRAHARLQHHHAVHRERLGA